MSKRDAMTGSARSTPITPSIAAPAIAPIGTRAGGIAIARFITRGLTTYDSTWIYTKWPMAKMRACVGLENSATTDPRMRKINDPKSGMKVMRNASSAGGDRVEHPGRRAEHTAADCGDRLRLGQRVGCLLQPVGYSSLKIDGQRSEPLGCEHQERCRHECVSHENDGNTAAPLHPAALQSSHDRVKPERDEQGQGDLQKQGCDRSERNPDDQGSENAERTDEPDREWTRDERADAEVRRKALTLGLRW